MAENYKILGQVAPAATTETDLYEAPAATEAVSSTVVICNRSGSFSGTARVSIALGGGATQTKDYIYYDLAIPANETFAATIGLCLEANDVMRVYSSLATMTFQLFGVEKT